MGQFSVAEVGQFYIAADNSATFKGELTLEGTKIDSKLEMFDSTFEGNVNLTSVTVDGAALLFGSTFDLDVDFTACTVSGGLDLGSSQDTAARWGDSAALKLCNTRVGAFQDWWQNENTNAWPKRYELEGFTYGRLGLNNVAEERAADMLDRAVGCYIDWLAGDPGSSSQPYEYLAGRFHEAGETDKSTRVLYAARERQRRKAWSKMDDYGHPKPREWPRALGLSALRLTIGYGLGIRYFRVLWWILGLTFVGAFMLIYVGKTASPQQWPQVLFASLDQLLPIVTLNKAHDALIFGDPTHEVPPYKVLIYFYAHKIAGWILGSFLVAGLAGLTQRS